MHAVRSLALPSRRKLLLILASGAAVLLAAALVVEPSGSNDSAVNGKEVVGLDEPARNVASPAEAAIGLDAGEAMKAEAEAEASGAADAAISPTDPAAAGVSTTIAPPELDAKIVRSGSVELRVKRARFEGAWGDAQSVAKANGGYIVAASRSGAGDGARSGTITMRIPTAKFDGAVDQLREVSGAKVRRLDMSSQDVTQEYVDTRSRLRHDRAVEARLLALLAQTKTVSEVLAVQGRLDQVQEQIELSKGRLDYLDKMTSMSTVDVTITAPAKGSADRDDDSEPGVLAESFGDAKERFMGNVAGAIVWFGGALPALILLALIALVARAAWRRIRPETASEQGSSE